MKENAGTNQSRRQVIIGFARYGVLAVLGFAAGALLVKRNKLIREGRCVNDGPGEGGCRKCVLLGECPLPRAMSARGILLKDKND